MNVAAAAVRTSAREETELATLAKALGHPARVQIVRLLLSRDTCYCGEIVEELLLAQATVSQHLKVLSQAGLIRGEIEGPRTCYCADHERLVSLHGLVGALLRDAVAPSEDGCGADD